MCVCQYVLVDAPSCQALAAVTLQLLQFQEDAFGRQAPSPALTKLHVSLPLTFTGVTHFTLSEITQSGPLVLCRLQSVTMKCSSPLYCCLTKIQIDLSDNSRV